MHFTHGDDAGQKVLPLAGVRLVDDAFIAVSGGAGFVGVDPGDQDQFIFYLVVDPGKPFYVLTDRILVIRGAGTDDDQKFVALAGDDGADLGIPDAF